MSRVSFATGRLILGLVLILMGGQIFLEGYETFDYHLHSLRKHFLPLTQDTDLVYQQYLPTLTFAQLNTYLIKAEGVIFCLSGLLIILNKKCCGSFLLIVGVVFILVTRDNPMIHSNQVTKGKENKERIAEVMRLMALVGGALLIMADRGDAKVRYVEKKTN